MSFRREYEPLLVAIADEADEIAMRFFRGDALGAERKRDGSVVTAADKAIEEMARRKVTEAGLSLDVLGEEFGGEAHAQGPRLIIDPIDGTEEFSRGIPTFGTLLGIENGGEIVAGLASAPALAARWSAYRGEGTWRDGRRLKVSDVARLRDAMVFTSGSDPSKGEEANGRIARLAEIARRSRAMGGFWQHMLVAEGAIDAAMDVRSKPWDLAADIIIVEEAGGRATTFDGKRSIYRGHLVSSNGLLHEEILTVLR
jgi:histidinol-phosphatase